MKNSTTLAVCLLHFWATSTFFAQKNDIPVLTTGMVRYAIISPSATDTGTQTLHFKPGKGASLIVNPVDSSGYHSIYDFEKDSVFNFLLGEKTIALPTMKLSEFLSKSKQTTTFMVKKTAKRKKILGYDCYEFKASSVGGADKMQLTGWATDQIQTQVRIIMDENLLSIGFPLEFSIKIPSVSKKSAVVFKATAVETTAKPKAFEFPKR